MILMTRTRHLTVLLAAAALPLASCASGASGEGDAAGGTTEVMASFYPLQYVAEQVGGEHVTVEALTPPGTEPHDLELAPYDVARMESADLVVYLSGFQAAVDDAVTQAGSDQALDVAEHGELVAPDAVREHAEDDHADGAHEEGDGHAHDADIDPHFWLDPTRLAQVADAVAQELAEVDPAGAADYAANAERLTEELAALDAELEAGLATCDSRTIVVSHAAYGYLAEAYDLDQRSISGVDPDTEPSPARLAEIGSVVTEEDVSTIFTESAVGAQVAETLAGDLGVRTAVLDPLEIQADQDADYPQVMRANLEALQEALGCR